MLKEKVWKKRALSFMLVFALVMANIVPAGMVSAGVVNAEDEIAAQNDTVSESFNEEKSQDTQESVSSDENLEDTDNQEKTENEDETVQTVMGDEETENQVKPGAQEEAIAQSEEPGEIVAQSGATGCGATVTIQLLGYKETIETTTVTMPNEYYTLAEYGFTGLADPGNYTVLHALAEYEVQKYGVNREDAAGLIDCPTGYINDIEGYISDLDASSYLGWVIWKDGAALQTGVATTPIADSNTLTFVAGWWYYSSGLYLSTSYCKFVSIPTDAIAEKQFNVSLSAIDTGNVNNPGNITVSAVDGEGNVVATGITDDNGVAKMRIPEAGTYQLTAMRHPDVYDYRVSEPVDITIPTGSITVGEKQELTDEEAVADVAKNIDIASVLTDDIELETSGDNGVSIVWTTDNEGVITKTGVITRKVFLDGSANLQAVIRKGECSVTKTFPVTVKGYEGLQTLDIPEGNLSTDVAAYQTSYLYYIDEDENQITLHVTPSEYTTFLWIKNGSQTVKMSFGADSVTAGIDVSSLRAGESMDLTLQLTLGSKGNGTVTVTIKKKNPGSNLTDLPTSWPQHLGGDDNNSVSKAELAADNTELIWENFAEGEGSWGSWYAGTPILVDGKLYAARNGQIQIINASTGVIEKRTDLKSALGFYSYITYGGGKIFVPLGNGSIQCFDAATLKSLFVTQIPGLGLSASSALYYKNGILYTGFTDWSQGYFAAYDTTDLDVDHEYEVVAPKWKYGNSSYYGMGAVESNGYLVFAGDADASGSATIAAVNPATGEEVSTMVVAGNVRCSIVESDGFLWLTTQDAKIYKLAVGTDGTLVNMASADLPSSTNASPVVKDGKVYVTGGNWGGGYLNVFDTQLNLLGEASTDGQANTPTVSVVNGITYVYFTQNAEPGALFAAKVTADNQITVSQIYTPAHENYSMSNVLIGEDGTIYYGNDAGYIYALKAKASNPIPSPKPTPKPEPLTPTIQNANKQSIVETKKATTKLLSANTTEEEDDTSDVIVKKIQSEISENKTSLTIKNAPDVIESGVFSELKKHPKFRMILDFGTYTMSMTGADVIDENSTLSARLIEEAGTLSEKQEDAVGTYQQLRFEQEGKLPGKFTIVYKLHDQLEKMTSGTLYQITNLTTGNEVTVDSSYAMFDLSECGTYILADESDNQETVDEINTTKASVTATEEGNDTPNETSNSHNGIIAIVVLAAVLIIGGGICATVIIRRRKEKTWEE